MTTATPDWLWLSSGVKAIDHCIEAWLSIRAQPITDALAAEALDKLLTYLPACRRDASNLAARLQCQIAAWLSVTGLANVSLGLSHALGHQLGAKCGVAHGYTSCVVLQHVIDFNGPATEARQTELRKRLNLASAGTPEGVQPLQAVVLRLVREDLTLPWRLRDVGVDFSDLPAVANAAMRDPLVASNPRPIESTDTVLDLLRNAW